MNPNLEFHKQKLAEILESHERGEAKTYTFEEFKSLTTNVRDKLFLDYRTNTLKDFAKNIKKKLVGNEL